METGAENEIDQFAPDRTHFSVARLTDPDDALAYWLSRPVEERLRALELLRRTCYGYTNSNSVEYLLVGGYAVGIHGHIRAAETKQGGQRAGERSGGPGKSA